MRHLFTLFFLIIATTYSLNAQKEETIFNKHGGVNFSGFWVSIYNTLTDFNKDYHFSNGGSFAFEFNKSYLVGWTHYKSDLTKSGQEISLSGNDLFLGYVHNSHKLVHPLLYLQGGSGRLRIANVGSDQIFAIQPTIGAEVNIAKWFRLGVDGGYRFVSGSDIAGVSDKELSGPTLGIRLKFGWSWGRSKGSADWDF